MRTCLSLAACLVCTTLFAEVFAQGSQYRTGEWLRVESADTLTRQLLGAARVVDMSGHIVNDLFLAGEEIRLDGSVGDDAFLAGRDISVHGRVEDMLVVAGETLHLQADVGGDLLLFGQSIHLQEGMQVGGNALLAGRDLHIESGTYAGRLRVAGQSVFLNGSIGGDVIIYSGDVTFGDAYEATHTRIVSHLPIVAEQLGEPPDRLDIDVREPPGFPVWLVRIWFFLSLLLCGGVLLWLFPAPAAGLYRDAFTGFWKRTGIGALILFLAPVLLMFLLTPLVTIPLVMMSFAIYVLSLFVGYLMLAMILGSRTINWSGQNPRRMHYFVGLAIGLVILYLLHSLPWIGWFVTLILVCFAIGRLWVWLFQQARLNKTREKPDTPPGQ